CQGDISHKPPIRFNRNMENQRRYEPQTKNSFFEDQRAMRPLVPGTIPRGGLKENDHLYKGVVNGTYAATLPMPLTKPLLQRGQARYNIYCTPCHGGAGFGDGIIISRGFIPPPSLHDERLISQPVGYFFFVMGNGIRTMPSYRSQIPVEDRWAIAAYVRALQLSRRASISQVPGDVAASKGWKQ
ncbi:MAG TPA: cytochrome c, partial [Bdellovibrionota bacterium]|nr:cytochrome c [Bdellovibrionota bacterium]